MIKSRTKLQATLKRPVSKQYLTPNVLIFRTLVTPRLLQVDLGTVIASLIESPSKKFFNGNKLFLRAAKIKIRKTFFQSFLIVTKIKI